MLEKLRRENPEAVKKVLEKRGQEINFSELLEWDSQRRELIGDMEALQGNRNKAAERIGKLKKREKRRRPSSLPRWTRSGSR